MRAMWILPVTILTILINAQATDTTQTTFPTTKVNSSLLLHNNDDYDDDGGYTMATPSRNNDSLPLQTPAGITSPPPIYTTGDLSYAAYIRMTKIQGWIYLGLEPLAVTLLVLSTVAFLQDRQSPSNIYLAAVCLAEAWYMAMIFGDYMCRLWRECSTSLIYVHVSTWTSIYSAFAARRCGNVLTALVSFQRFVAVAFPLKSMGVRFLRRPAYPLMLCVMLCHVLSLYRPIRHAPVHQEGGGWTKGFSSLFAEHESLFMGLEEAAKYVLQYVPMLVCLLANCLLLAALARHRRDTGHLHGPSHSQDNPTRNKAERQMTVMILGSTFLMLVLNTPVNLNEAVSTYSADYGIMKRNHYFYLVVRGALSIVSHACDILVALSYLILSANFRRRFLGLFSPLRRLLGCLPTPPPPSAGDTKFSVTQVTSADLSRE